MDMPPDIEALVQKQLETGAFSDAEDVIRCALETLAYEERWTAEERRALDEKIDRALADIRERHVYGPEESRQKLAALREAHSMRAREELGTGTEAARIARG